MFSQSGIYCGKCGAKKRKSILSLSEYEHSIVWCFIRRSFRSTFDAIDDLFWGKFKHLYNQ